MFLTMVMVTVRLSRNLTFTLWLRYFNEGEGSRSDCIMEAFLHNSCLGTCYQACQRMD